MQPRQLAAAYWPSLSELQNELSDNEWHKYLVQAWFEDSDAENLLCVVCCVQKETSAISVRL